jgi:hypothetical protein
MVAMVGVVGGVDRGDSVAGYVSAIVDDRIRGDVALEMAKNNSEQVGVDSQVADRPWQADLF